MKKLKDRLAGLVMAASLAVGGCVIVPKPGEFEKRKLIAIPHHPVIMMLFGGEYICTKREEEGRIVIDIERMHWLLGKIANPKIKLPYGARNIGMKECLGGFWISYDLEGKRFLDHYHIGDLNNVPAPTRYVYDENQKKFIRRK